MTVEEFDENVIAGYSGREIWTALGLEKEYNENIDAGYSDAEQLNSLRDKLVKEQIKEQEIAEVQTTAIPLTKDVADTATPYDTLMPTDTTITQTALRPQEYGISAVDIDLDIETKDVATPLMKKTGELKQTIFNAALQKPALGIARIGENAWNWGVEKFGEAFDYDMSKEAYSTLVSEYIKENSILLEDTKNKLVEDGVIGEDDILTPELYGEIAGEVIAFKAGYTFLKSAGVKTKSLWDLVSKWEKTSIATGAGIYGALRTYGEVDESTGKLTTVHDSAMEGIVEGIYTLGGVAAVEWAVKSGLDPKRLTTMITGKATEKQTIRELERLSQATDNQLSEWYAASAIALGKAVDELTDSEKVMSLVSNSPAGKVWGQIASSVQSGENINSLIGIENSQREAIIDVTSSGDFTFAADKLGEYLDTTSTLYSDMKKGLLENFDTDISVNQDQFNQFSQNLQKGTTTTNKVEIDSIIETLQEAAVSGNPIDLDTLLDLRYRLNALSLKGMQEHTRAEVKGFIDKLFKDNVEGDGYSLFQELSKRYSVKKLIEGGDNWLGTKLIELKDKKISLDEFTNEVIAGRGRGEAVFSQLLDVLGPEASSQLESKIINTLFTKKPMGEAIEEAMSYDFASKEGIGLKKELNRISSLLIKSGKGTSTVGLGREMAALTGNLFNKFRYWFVGKVGHEIAKRSPGWERERVFNKLGDIIRNSSDQDIKTLMNKVEIDHEAREIFVAEQNKLVERIEGLKNSAQRSARSKPTVVSGQEKKKAEKLNLAVANAEFIVEKIEANITKREDDLIKLYQKLESPTANHAKIWKKIDELEEYISRSKKQLEIKKEAHRIKAKELESLNVKIEAIEGFDPRREPSDSLKVINKNIMELTKQKKTIDGILKSKAFKKVEFKADKKTDVESTKQKKAPTEYQTAEEVFGVPKDKTEDNLFTQKKKTVKPKSDHKWDSIPYTHEDGRDVHLTKADYNILKSYQSNIKKGKTPPKKQLDTYLKHEAFYDENQDMFAKDSTFDTYATRSQNLDSKYADLSEDDIEELNRLNATPVANRPMDTEKVYYTGSAQSYDFKDFNMGDTTTKLGKQRNNMGPGLYLADSQETLTGKVKEKKVIGDKYKVIRPITLPKMNIMKFNKFQEYQQALTEFYGTVEPDKQTKHDYNMHLKDKGYDGIAVDTVGHKGQTVVFNEDIIKLAEEVPF